MRPQNHFNFLSASALTIISDHDKPQQHRSGDPETLALSALAWILADEQRAERLLALTGLTPAVLRERLMDRQVQCAVLEFLANHEPDLVLAADALNVAPEDVVAAYRSLSV